MEINPLKIYGNWKEGWALDRHTYSSTPVQDDAGKVIRWDTKRPPIAEELYRLKYWQERFRIKNIAEQAANFLNQYKFKWQLEVIVPVPPSDLNRDFQPVYDLARVIGHQTNIDVDLLTIMKIKSTSQLKALDNSIQRKELLQGAFTVSSNNLEGKNVLVFDDLCRSGETLSAICDVIINMGNAKNVYAFTITKTRSKR